ncbi:peptide/nickel transport system permease protein [Desulfonispora thiosulfatigenes DSM 11270]|uniref:Peptide/nickel transport system permease protein n=1 Tax=Desulfonispora thiosulfatigenes DSM 11270 TaxID=656914 RepID=A0A1W1V8M4_DESTI|nr:ABC transporter permease [Desulfonispora thiosulfatigenes]SMB89665.1 peptide/nickel transport system permease protein [Desulfonispora thiosulfatigenes DSM 11270]
MINYLINRLIQSTIVLFIISIMAFTLIHVAPGDPVDALYGPIAIQKMRTEDKERIRANMGLDKPIPIQYAKWAKGVLKGDWGNSYISGRPVSKSIMERLPATMLLAGSASLIILIISILLGIYTGLHRNSVGDHIATIISLVLVSTPGFWLSLMLILIFSVFLKWLPSAGMTTIGSSFSLGDILKHLILPAVVLAFSHIGYYIRFIRASVWEQMKMDYVLALKARGVKEKTIIYKHVLKNSLLPFVNYLGATIPIMLSGAVVIEQVFAWPGLGQLSVNAAIQKDYSLLMGTILFTGFLVVIGNLCADIISMLLDPRIAAGQLGKEVKTS